jgi:hypothetical protein
VLQAYDIRTQSANTSQSPVKRHVKSNGKLRRACEEVRPFPIAKKRATDAPIKLSATEQDLLRQIEQGFPLETDSLGNNPVLRRLYF